MTFDGLTDMARESERLRQRRADNDPQREVHTDVDQMPGSATRAADDNEPSDLPMDERESLQDDADTEAAEGH